MRSLVQLCLMALMLIRPPAPPRPPRPQLTAEQRADALFKGVGEPVDWYPGATEGWPNYGRSTGHYTSAPPALIMEGNTSDC